MFELFNRTRKLHEAEATYARSVGMANPADLRRKVEIVAIDDQEFYPETNLRNAGFNVITRRDIQQLHEVEPFSIVLCDVNGVGTALNAGQQGAFVIQEIIANFPDKIVIAYTAGGLNQANVRLAKQAAHGYLRKDASVDEWRDLLDEKIRVLVNPIEMWKLLRLRLLMKGIELSDLMRLEQVVLKNVSSGAKTTKEALAKTLKGEGKSAWESEVTKFIASKAFELAFAFAKHQVIPTT
jgi:DNA-binding NarL/FixJ family response regulator